MLSGDSMLHGVTVQHSPFQARATTAGRADTYRGTARSRDSSVEEVGFITPPSALSSNSAWSAFRGRRRRRILLQLRQERTLLARVHGAPKRRRWVYYGIAVRPSHRTSFASFRWRWRIQRELLQLRGVRPPVARLHQQPPLRCRARWMPRMEATPTDECA